MEDEVKNELVTIIKLVINSGKAETMVRHQWKAYRFMNSITAKFTEIQRIMFVQWNCRRLRNKLHGFQQRSQNIDVTILSEIWFGEAEGVYPEGFDVVKKERNEKSGGLAIFINIVTGRCHTTDGFLPMSYPR
jgi:hypothetical protein